VTVPQVPLLVSREGRSCFQALTPKCTGDEYPRRWPLSHPLCPLPLSAGGGRKAGLSSERSAFSGYNLVLERRGRKLSKFRAVSLQRLVPGAASPRARASAAARPPAATGRRLRARLAAAPPRVCTLGRCELQTARSGETKLRPTHLLGIWGAGVTRPGGAGKSTLLTDTCYVHVCYCTRHTRG